MLDNATVEEVQRLLDVGQFSQRKIAEIVGISRGTVTSIANGRRQIVEPDWLGGAEETRSEEPERCPGCGWLVRMPCVFCAAKTLGRLRIVPKSAGSRCRSRSNVYLPTPEQIEAACQEIRATWREDEESGWQPPVIATLGLIDV